MAHADDADNGAVVEKDRGQVERHNSSGRKYSRTQFTDAYRCCKCRLPCTHKSLYILNCNLHRPIQVSTHVYV